MLSLLLLFFFLAFSTISVQVAKWVGDLFNKGLYDMHIEFKDWPLLEWEAEPIWET